MAVASELLINVLSSHLHMGIASGHYLVSFSDWFMHLCCDALVDAHLN